MDDRCAAWHHPFHWSSAAYTIFFFFFSPIPPLTRTTPFTVTDKSPKSAAGRTNINNGMIMNQIAREKPISYWPAGANDWPRGIPARLSIPRCSSSLPAFLHPLPHPRRLSLSPSFSPTRPLFSFFFFCFLFFSFSRVRSRSRSPGFAAAGDTSAIGQRTQCIFFN